jgi:TP901-1 family phage major tail protein
MADNFLNGSDLLVYIGANPVAFSRSCSISMNVNMADATTKDNNGYAESIPTTRSWECSVDGLGVWNSNIKEFMAAFTGKTLLDIKVKPRNAAASDLIYSGKCYIESLEISGEMEEGVTYSASLKGTGALTFAVATV